MIDDLETYDFLQILSTSSPDCAIPRCGVLLRHCKALAYVEDNGKITPLGRQARNRIHKAYWGTR